MKKINKQKGLLALALCTLFLMGTFSYGVGFLQAASLPSDESVADVTTQQEADAESPEATNNSAPDEEDTTPALAEDSSQEADNSTEADIPSSSQPVDASQAESQTDLATVESTESEAEGNAVVPMAPMAAMAPAAATITDEILIDGTYLTSSTNGRQELDLKKLKDQGILTGTLVFSGTYANKAFIRIVDSSLTETGIYNISLGDYAGVEIPTETGTLNTFDTISNQQGISNLMPIFVNTSVNAIIIDNNGSKINLLPQSYNISTTTRNLAVVINGSETKVNTLSLKDIAVTNYNQSYSGSYVYPVFMGVQGSATVDSFVVGNVDISYGNAQLGGLIGAVGGQINHFDIVGNLNLTGTILSGGLPSASYTPGVILGVSNNTSIINTMTIKAGAKVNLKDISSSSSTSVVIGFSSYNAAQSEGKLIAEPGSEINFTNFRSTDTLTIPLGGEAKYMDFGGNISMRIMSSSTNVIIGKGYNTSITNDMLLIRKTANIQLSNSNYVSVAIGYGANISASPMNNFVIEQGANLDLSIDKTYSIRDYYTVDSALGGNNYSSPNKVLIGATYNDATGGYEIIPTSDPAQQTQIHLTNYRKLVGAVGSSNSADLYRKPVLSANVYAEYSLSKHEFFGANGYVILQGGNYLAKELESGEVNYISFTESRTGSYNSLKSVALNQFYEPLQQKLYQDDTLASSFSANIPAANFDGSKPEYDYLMTSSFNSSISPALKAYYYPNRALYLRLTEPAPNGNIHVNGTLAIEFDHQIFAEDHINQGKVITVTQNGQQFPILLDDAHQDLYTFGSSLGEEQANFLYIHLDKLTNSLGEPLTPNTLTTLTLPSTFHRFFEVENPQLLTERTAAPYSTNFTVTEAIYNVAFDQGESPAARISDQAILRGESIVKPADPVWEEHVFEGWYVMVDGSPVLWNFSDPVLADTTLVASWKLKTYTVSYVVDDSSTQVTPANAIAYAKGETVVVDSQKPTKAGYNFISWLADFDGNTYEAGSTFINPGQNVTLTATWAKIPAYQVTYDFGDGRPSQSASVLPGELLSEIAAPTRSGYTFLGWYQDSLLWNFGIMTMPNQDITLTAHWETEKTEPTPSVTPTPTTVTESTVTPTPSQGAVLGTNRDSLTKTGENDSNLLLAALALAVVGLSALGGRYVFRKKTSKEQ